MVQPRTPAKPPETRVSVPPPGTLPHSPSTELGDTTDAHRSANHAAPRPTDTTDSAIGKDSDTADPSDTADANQVPCPRQGTPTRRSQPGARRATRRRTDGHTSTPADTATNALAAGREDRHKPHTTGRVFSPPRFRGYRHVRELTHSEVAQRAGLTPTDIDHIEKGEQVPEPSTIATLATVLECTAADLYATGDPMDNTQYWDVKCAALPPLSAEAIRSVAATLDRIEARRIRRSTR